MQLTSLFTDDEGVSPVIGVILMVAITVILAAVIGTFVLGLGEGVSSTSPSASFEFEYESGSGVGGSCPMSGATSDLDITHASGDPIPADQLTISDGSTTANWYECSSTGENSDVTAGSTAVVSIDDGDTIRVLWSKDDDSATLTIWNGPNA